MTLSASDENARALWVETLPRYVSRALIVGGADSLFVRPLEARDISVRDFPADRVLDAALEPPFDLIVLEVASLGPDALPEALRALTAATLPETVFCLVFEHPPVPAEREAVERASAGADLKPRDLRRFQDEQGHDIPDDAPERLPNPRVVVAMRADYDLCRHARQLLLAGRLEASLDVLSRCGGEYTADPVKLARIAFERCLCLVAWFRTARDEQRLRCFFEAQKHFYLAVSLAPTFTHAYQLMAELWHRMGDDDMAARLLRSVQHVAPMPAVEQQLTQYRPAAKRPATTEAAPLVEVVATPPRILIATHEGYDVGVDILYDGLCRVLGPDNVVEWPWKPTLHGAQFDDVRDYPCDFDWPGEAREPEQVLEELKAERYDAILFADVLHHRHRNELRRIMAAARNTPVFLLDTWDTADDARKPCLEYLGIPAFRGHFKREMLPGVDYGPNAFPLPLAFPEGRIPEKIEEQRPDPVFWAGNRHYGLRRLYLERVETILGTPFTAVYPQEEYSAALQRAAIGIDIFGFGYDTMRYWELPAYGCMMLAERKPIRIPHDFRDGESAVFFDDLPELEEKLRHYLAHPGDARAIARAGHAQLRQYHTGTARARQLLGWMEGLLRK